MSYIEEICKNAKKASRELTSLSAKKKNIILRAMSDALINSVDEILLENNKDIENGKKKNLSEAFLDRLKLNKERIEGMSKSLIKIADFQDPIGETVKGWKLENQLKIDQVRVPIGVIAMIFESRPNVTVDAAGLCLKSGNAIILRGGSDAINSNKALSKIIIEAGIKAGMPKGAVQLIEKTDRKLVGELLSEVKYIDAVIPRGGKSLKKAINETSKVPVIETGAGVCHLYIDEFADDKMGVDILINGKTQRPGVCNALETLLIHESKLGLLGEIEKRLKEKKVEIIADTRASKYLKDFKLATEADWEEEYLSLKISIKTVSSIEEAIDHIEKYSTKHSEAIITTSFENSEKFLQEVDSACVYVNASTRFTDGGEFGFGGEIGISTQKLHARGPMGIRELTTTKYIIRGNGQVRS
ncbi:MAG: glutamate-5-semialdehyde dehydrogenase [Fusobacterium sp.]